MSLEEFSMNTQQTFGKLCLAALALWLVYAAIQGLIALKGRWLK